MRRILTADEAQAIGREELAKRQAQTEQDALDATRYRWLRDHGYLEEVFYAAIRDWQGEALFSYDATIDQLMRDEESPQP